MENYLKENYVIFCDFDGTITKEDAINKLFETFAEKSWLAIEKSWQDGLIGSKECLEKQLNCIKNISENGLNAFIDQIKIDESFIDFINFVCRNKIDFYIVSDGFDLIISKVLNNYGIKNIKIYSNRLEHKNNKLIPYFDFHCADCNTKAGLCKCNVIKENHNSKKIIYIGDGLSDICAAKFADILFAKNKLMEYAELIDMNHTPFSVFGEILSILQKKGEIHNDRIEHCNR